MVRSKRSVIKEVIMHLRHRRFYLVSSLLIASLLFGGASCSGAKRKAVERGKPADVLACLMKGNERFVDGNTRRKELVAGQKSPAIVLACSDSRVAPEILFDRGLGDLFVVRVAGNVANTENVASIEYAIEHLGSSLIVVMGHDSCGAVKAAVDYSPGGSGFTKDLVALVENIRANIAKGGGILKAVPGDSGYRSQAIANVRGVIKGLMAGSEVVSRAVKAGSVALVPVMYSLETGKVEVIKQVR